MVHDTDCNIKHRCGRVVDYCLLGTTRILFCIYCKKVVGHAKEDSTKIQISITLGQSLPKNKYDEDLLKKWV